MTDGIFTPEVKSDIRARAKAYRENQAEVAKYRRETWENRIDEANQEIINLRRLAIDLGYHYAMSLPADSWEDRVWAVVKDAGLLKAIRDEVKATADKHADWREP